MTDAFSLWRKSRGGLKADDPTPGAVIFENPPNPDTEGRQIGGYWRQVSGKTKPDVPVLIWPAAENPEVMTWQEGARRPKNTAHDLQDWLRFLDMGAGKLVAVTKAEFHKALETGLWSDGKKAREMSEAERLDVIPTTSPEEGGNMPEDLAAQYAAKIEAQIKRIEALGVINGAETANSAAQIITDLRSLWKMADGKRAELKRPHDEAAAAVQAAWKPMLDTAELAAKKLLAAVDGWQKAEQRRLQKEADEKAAAERKRIADETAARLRAEAEARAAEAEDGEVADVPSDDDIRARAEQVAAETAPPPEVVEKPKASGAFSRAVSKAKTRKATIIDIRAMAEHFIHAGDDDFTGYMQKRADAAARAKITLPGTKVSEE